MSDFLVKKFVKGYQNTTNSKVRTAYGKLAGMVGIVCNVILFIMKIVVGTLSGSVSITADAVNNLSDASSSIVSLMGFKMSDKPADEEHPYGHGRFEYLSGLLVAVLIIVIGVELFRGSLDKILNPSKVEFSLVTVGVLVFSVALKLWMSLFNYKLGKKINSSTLKATGADSRNDVIATTAVLISAVVSYFSGFELDGWMGIAVSIFIMYSGIGIVKETLNPLLGKAPDAEFVKEIRDKILSYEGVLGTHDLLVHDYGPGRLFASVHVEMAAEADPLESHEMIDTIERDFYAEGLHLIVHFDPIVTSDERVTTLRYWLSEQVGKIDGNLSIHDLRIVPGVKQTNVIFDCVVPFDFNMTDDELKKKICSVVSDNYPTYKCVITIDKSFAAMPHWW